MTEEAALAPAKLARLRRLEAEAQAAADAIRDLYLANRGAMSPELIDEFWRLDNAHWTARAEANLIREFAL